MSCDLRDVGRTIEPTTQRLGQTSRIERMRTTVLASAKDEELIRARHGVGHARNPGHQISHFAAYDHDGGGRRTLVRKTFDGDRRILRHHHTQGRVHVAVSARSAGEKERSVVAYERARLRTSISGPCCCEPRKGEEDGE